MAENDNPVLGEGRMDVTVWAALSKVMWADLRKFERQVTKNIFLKGEDNPFSPMNSTTPLCVTLLHSLNYCLVQAQFE